MGSGQRRRLYLRLYLRRSGGAAPPSKFLLARRRASHPPAFKSERGGGCLWRGAQWGPVPTPAVQWGRAGPRQNYARACAAAAIFPGLESGVGRGACSLRWVWRPLRCDPSRRGHWGVSTRPRIFIAEDLLSLLLPVNRRSGRRVPWYRSGRQGPSQPPEGAAVPDPA